MAIGGQRRENNQEGFSKKVGLFAAKVVAVNPTEKEYKDILGIELKEDSKAAEYLGERDGNTVLRVDFWLKQVKIKDIKKDGEETEDTTEMPIKVSFFLEDKIRTNKDDTKTQYINSIGNCAWGAEESDLPEWFTKRDYRPAFHGEEDLFEFMRSWLNKLDYREAETALVLEWKKLMKGDVREIKGEVGGEWAGPVGCLATVIIKEVDGENKEYQGVFNRAFVSVYNLKHFRLVDYDNPEVLSALGSKPSKDLKPFERFILKVTGEYGCKDFYCLKDIKDYDANDNPVATNAPLTEGGASY